MSLPFRLVASKNFPVTVSALRTLSQRLDENHVRVLGQCPIQDRAVHLGDVDRDRHVQFLGHAERRDRDRDRGNAAPGSDHDALERAGSRAVQVAFRVVPLIERAHAVGPVGERAARGLGEGQVFRVRVETELGQRGHGQDRVGQRIRLALQGVEQRRAGAGQRRAVTDLNRVEPGREVQGDQIQAEGGHVDLVFEQP
jgi:hypothetical protein